MRKIFRDLTSVKEARKIFYQYADPKKLGTEKVELLKALDRVISNDIYSPGNVPPFDRGSMDGFAVIAADLAGAEEDKPVKLRNIGEVRAGYVFEGVVERGSCVEISTGAPLPTGADSVVMVEYTDRDADVVSITRMVTPGENVVAAGTDIQKGERVIVKNTLLTSRELGVIAAMGISEVEVIKKPSIAIFSSGDEVMEIGSELKPGKLYDINSTAIASNIIEQGGVPEYLGIIPDQYEAIENALRSTLGKYELVLISGGTSAGMGDMLYEIIDSLERPGLLVHGIKVKPGKPTILGVCGTTPIIGLPGYPASALSIYKLFVVPYIRKLAGLQVEDTDEQITATVKQRIRSVMGRHEFKPMNLIHIADEYTAYPVPGGSGAITSIALADGFVEIPENTSFILPNTEVKISLFSKNIKLPDIQIIGSHCVALARLQTLFTEKYPQFTSRSISVGSTGGVASVRRGECHVAGIHVLNENGIYNSWLIENTDMRIIKGYNRNQGLIVKKGNPKQIFTVKDLTRDDVRMINRNPGSGTRILLDLFLDKIGIERTNIDGYDNFVRSHSSAAQAVKSPHVDVALGIENVTDNDLDFIMLREEEYDFLISSRYENTDAIDAFISTLRSDEFKEILASLRGYSVRD